MSAILEDYALKITQPLNKINSKKRWTEIQKQAKEKDFEAFSRIVVKLAVLCSSEVFCNKLN